MTDFVIWLYGRCAEPWVREEKLPAGYQLQLEEWQLAIQGLPRRERLLCVDVLDHTRLLWGASSFLRGLRLGMLLAREMPGGEGWEEAFTSLSAR